MKKIVLSRLFQIIFIILNIIAFIQFKNDNTDLLPFVTILNILDLIFGGFKGLWLNIIAFIGAMFIVKEFWLGLELSLISVNILYIAFNIIIYIIGFVGFIASSKR